MESKIATDYEQRFRRAGFIIKDLFERYTNIIRINNGDASEHLPIYRLIIKNHVQTEILKLKDWLDTKYFSKEKIPIGTYIQQQFSELERNLVNVNIGNKTKQNALKDVLSDICESLDTIEPKVDYHF